MALALALGATVLPATAEARIAKTVKVVCVKDADGAVRYVRKASSCRGTEHAVKLPSEGPLPACRAKGGKLRAVADLTDCAASKRVTLASTKTLNFCVKKRGGATRLARKCRRSEFAAKLKKHRYKAPSANADAGTTDEDSPVKLDVIANDSGPGSLRVASIDAGGAHGTVTIAAGHLLYDPAGRFNSLAAGAAASDTFTYRTTNGVATSAPATVTVTVNGSNDAPTAGDDAGATNARLATTLSVLANDSDSDAGDSVKVDSVDTTGTLGTVTIGAEGGSVHYDPAGQFAGLNPGQTATDTFKYRASDGQADSGAATVTVTVSGSMKPQITTTAASQNYPERGFAVAVDSNLGVVDLDSQEFQGPPSAYRTASKRVTLSRSTPRAASLATTTRTPAC